MIKNISRISNTFVKLLFILFPYLPAIIYGLIYNSGGWNSIYEGHDLDYYFLPEIRHDFFQLLTFIFLLTLFLLIIFLSVRFSPKRDNSKLANLLCSVTILWIGLTIRLCFISRYKNNIVPFSDFHRVWDMANGNLDGHLSYYKMFPAYVNFTVFEKKIISVFGYDFLNIIYLNCLLSAFSGLLIYQITAKLSQNVIVSLCAGVLYVLMPANILFCSVGAPDFLTVFLDLAGLFCLISSFSRRGLVSIILCSLGGILIGIGRAYKEFGILIIIAFTIVRLMELIINNEKTNRVIGFVIIELVLVLLCSQSAKDWILKNSEKVLNVDLDYSVSTPHFLLVGLNTQGEGQIHIGRLSREYALEYMRNGNDFTNAEKHALAILKQDWKENPNDILHNFYMKTIWAWQDDNIPLHYVLDMLPPEKYSNDNFYLFLHDNMAGVSQFYYLLLMVLACAGTALFIIFTKYRIEENSTYIIILTIFGYFCFMLLSESQSRYKILIMPFICIMAAIPLSFLSKKRNTKIC